MVLIPTLVQASPNCSANPILCDILKLKPSVNQTFARNLSNSIAKYSKKFGTDPRISVAIAMQESSFENKNRMGSLVTKDGHIIYGVTDVGVFQLHVNTIANIQKAGDHIDIQRLKTDVDYQTYWHAKILKTKVTTCKAEREKLKVSEGNEWSCYHSFTPDKRKVYLKDVGTHLRKLDEWTYAFRSMEDYYMERISN